MLADNIKALRMQNGLTQKDLADKLHVTSQAVSRWEKGDVEPSIDTISNMAKIFNVSTDELILGLHTSDETQEQTVDGEPTQPVVEPVRQPQTIIEREVIKEQTKPVLAVCEICNKPIYDGNEIVRFSYRGGRQTIHCRTCENKQQEAHRAALVANGVRCRNRSFIFGGIITAVVFAILLGNAISTQADDGVFTTIFGSIMTFTFASCLLLKNNFVGDLFLTIASWGFVKFPGLIFSLDLDGIIWLLTVKLLFFVLGILLAIFMAFVALIICLLLSIVVYPFALIKSFRHPEKSDD